MDRRKGNPDYTQTNNQFISLVKGEYGHTPVAVDPAFREKITGDATEKPYDVSSYKKPENPTVADLGGVPLASNNEEYLLLELLPNVANKFLRNRREEEYKAKQPAEAPKAEAAAEAPAKAAADEPITGEVFRAPMGGRIVEIKVKAGDTVKKGAVMMVYEAMKMENDLEAPRDLTVKRVFVAPDEVVGTDALLIEFE
jgi:pyruvate carboxylase subunit B